MGNALIVMCTIISLGLFVAFGIPMFKGYSETNEKVSEFARILEEREQDRCFRDAAKQAKVNAEFGKAVGSVLTGDEASPAKAD